MPAKKQPRAVVAEVKRSVEALQKLLMDTTHDLAKSIIDKYPFVDEYCQAMGSATFDITVAGISFMVSLDSSSPLREVENHPQIREISLSSRDAKSLAQFAADCQRLQVLHDTWSDYFTGSLAGESFRIYKDGAVKTEW